MPSNIRMENNNRSIGWRSQALLIVAIVLTISLAYADSYSSSQPSHQTLYADTLTSKTDGSPVRVADSDGFQVTTGNVGIGTTNPSYKLYIYDSSSNGLMVDAAGTAVQRFGREGIPKWGFLNNHEGLDNFGIFDYTRYDYALVFKPNADSYFKTGNVGIGTTTPAQKLDVNGQIHATGDICTDANGGKCLSTAGSTGSSQWVTAGSDIYYTAGKVGIGTATPAQVLEVFSGSDTTRILWGQNIRNNGNADVSGYGSGLKLKISSEGLPNEAHKWIGLAAVAGSGYGNRVDLAIYANDNTNNPPVEKFRILGNGQVGIGTSTPDGKVHILSTSGHIIMQDLDEGGSLRLERDNGGMNVELVSSNTNLFRVDDNGNVGVGTTSPSQKLEIVGDILLNTQSNPMIRFSHGETITYASIYRESPTGKLFIKNDQGNPIILDNGNVGIGTANPNRRLVVYGSDASLGLLSSDGYQWDFVNSPLWAPGTFHIWSRNPDSPRLSIQSDGNVGIGTINPASAKLQVYASLGNIAYFDGTNDGWVDTNGNFVGQNGNVRVGNANGAPGIVGDNSDLHLSAYNSDISGIRIKSSGNVGIGTINPGSKATVAGGDVYVSTMGNGIILKDTTDGTCRRVVLTSGALSISGIIACPAT